MGAWDAMVTVGLGLRGELAGSTFRFRRLDLRRGRGLTRGLLGLGLIRGLLGLGLTRGLLGLGLLSPNLQNLILDSA